MKHHRPILIIIIAVLIVCLVSIALIAILWKTLLLNFAENKFRVAFKGSSVRIGSRDITPGTLAFYDIDITTKGQPFLKIKEFRLNFIIFYLIKDRAAEFFIEDAVVYAKLKIPEVRGLARYTKGALALDNVSAQILNGVAEGGATIKPGKMPYYSVALKLKDIQLEKAVEVFQLSEKINATGSASGSLELSGEGFKLIGLKGKFEASPEGGMLTIKDKKWLDAIALYLKQDVNMIVENFKNYHYNEGNASLGLKETSIIVDVHLSGESGKRDLSISLHGFN
ncbi:MAG: YdbH domain-containing protein [Candidatus Omnitrophota bacterium]|nr:YdbH domain-containing protein [Candidatus Omnitrophota bacterium]